MAAGCGRARRHPPRNSWVLPRAESLEGGWHTGTCPRSLQQLCQSHAGLPHVLDAAPVTFGDNRSWGAARKRPPPSAGCFRDTSTNVAAELSISSLLFGNRPGAGGNAPLGVQLSPGGVATPSQRRAGSSAPCSHLHLSFSIPPGELQPAGPASEAAGDAEQEAQRWICIPWEGSQGSPEERGAASFRGRTSRVFTVIRGCSQDPAPS